MKNKIKTFGGEIEVLVGNKNGFLQAVDIDSTFEDNMDGGKISYDSCTHLLEINLNVSKKLGDIIGDVKKSIIGLLIGIHNSGNVLINTSTYPLGTYKEAYENNVKKIVYSLVRGPANDNENKLFDKLGNNYKHRNWKHEYSSLFAGIQPWNGIDISNIESTFKSLYIFNSLSKFISSNGSFIHGEKTKFDDLRFKMYSKEEGMLSQSIYKEDLKILETFPDLDFRLSNYIKNLFSNSYVSFIGTKNKLLALKNPKKVFDLLEEENIDFVDSISFENVILNNIYDNISFNDLFESTLYFPDFKLRIVGGKLIKGDNFRKLIKLIKTNNENELKNFFNKFNIEFAIEGRNYSTVLPEEGDFTLTIFPFIFQTLIIEKSAEINNFLEKNNLNISIFSNFDINNKNYYISLLDIIFSNIEHYDSFEKKKILEVKNKVLDFLLNNTNRGKINRNKYIDATNYLKNNLI